MQDGVAIARRGCLLARIARHRFLPRSRPVGKWPDDEPLDCHYGRRFSPRSRWRRCGRDPGTEGGRRWSKICRGGAARRDRSSAVPRRGISSWSSSCPAWTRTSGREGDVFRRGARSGASCGAAPESGWRPPRPTTCACYGSSSTTPGVRRRPWRTASASPPPTPAVDFEHGHVQPRKVTDVTGSRESSRGSTVFTSSQSSLSERSSRFRSPSSMTACL